MKNFSLTRKMGFKDHVKYIAKMFKNGIVFMTVLIITTLFITCGHKYQGKLVPMFDNSIGKWGFADTLGKIVIAPQWDFAKDFSDGLAVVGLNNKYGYIDKTGSEIIPLKYDSIGYLSNNLALVSLNGKWGFVDKTDTEKIPIIYDKAEPFYDGLSEVELDGKIGSIDTTGTIIVPFQYKELQYLIGSWGMSQFLLNTHPDDALGLHNFGVSFNYKESFTLAFQKGDSLKSSIDLSESFEGDFKMSKSLKIGFNKSWKIENFVIGQQQNDKYIFTCNLRLSPYSKETIYRLTLVSKDKLRMEFYEEFNVASRQTQYGVTKGGIIHLRTVFDFKRL